MSLPWLVSLRLSRFDDDAGYPVVAFPCLDGGLHCEGGAIVAPANFCSDGQVPGFVGLRRLVRHTCLEPQVRALAAPAEPTLDSVCFPGPYP